MRLDVGMLCGLCLSQVCLNHQSDCLGQLTHHTDQFITSEMMATLSEEMDEAIAYSPNKQLAREKMQRLG